MIAACDANPNPADDKAARENLRLLIDDIYPKAVGWLEANEEMHQESLAEARPGESDAETLQRLTREAEEAHAKFNRGMARTAELRRQPGVITAEDTDPMPDLKEIGAQYNRLVDAREQFSVVTGETVVDPGVHLGYQSFPEAIEAAHIAVRVRGMIDAIVEFGDKATTGYIEEQGTRLHPGEDPQQAYTWAAV